VVPILLSAFGILLEVLFVSRSCRTRDWKCLLLKAAASAVFVVLAWVCICYRAWNETTRLIFAGLCCGFAGDVLMGARFLSEKFKTGFFMLGLFCFMAGHALYACNALLIAGKSWKYALVCALLLLAAAGYLAHRMEVRPGKLTVPGVVYFAVLFFAVFAALWAGVMVKSAALLLFAAGGFSFALSDFLLLLENFGPEKNLVRAAASHLLYYFAQLLIALSILFFF
jgi:uncharacterized membrane protein YhhN